jgi:hypothetical protein
MQLIATRIYHDFGPKTGQEYELRDRMLRTACGSFALMIAGERPGGPARWCAALKRARNLERSRHVFDFVIEIVFSKLFRKNQIQNAQGAYPALREGP